MNIVVLLLSALMPMVLHELGHFIAAYIFTQEKIKFYFSWGKAGKLTIPRWV